MVYSIILTTLANDLKVYDYLVYLLKQMPNTDFDQHPELIEKFIPWSKELQDDLLCMLTVTVIVAC
ncbi:transposase domain-containing protein [Desulfosporosinus sp. SB140]|uniref:transposase domain-containing protein n=1 Tax=Desulfosporosinus paludis TaxID=3115649 RepID=UPI0038908EB9